MTSEQAYAIEQKSLDGMLTDLRNALQTHAEGEQTWGAYGDLLHLKTVLQDALNFITGNEVEA